MLIRLAPDIRRIEVLDEGVAAVLRSKTGAERQVIADEMFHFARQMLLARIASDHPDWSPDRVNAEAARRLSHGAIDAAQTRGERRGAA